MTEAAVECCRPTEIVPSAEPITVDTLPVSEPIKRLESKATGKSPPLPVSLRHPQQSMLSSSTSTAAPAPAAVRTPSSSSRLTLPV
ncbi:hypothetical protein FoTM2_013431 [Fusarium oxysporum f. sp. vasinfectum]|nr:hypothetical protein FoTM2_013431 [Fusarium oxysporum f. sp. vasinfectum]